MFSNFNFEFQNPWFLLLFLLIIPLIIIDVRKKPREGIAVPSTENMAQDSRILFILFLLKISKYIVLSCLFLALARPRTYSVSQDQDPKQGVDIMLSVDVSLSMLAKDLEPDRLTALKNIAKKFVDQRPNDRIGLVTYSGEAITKVPLTTDHQVVTDELENLNPTELQPGTAIGEGLAVAVNHIKDSKAKSKIIILMTDGENNVENAIPPITGAQLAKANGIKVYTIGIGTNGFALFPSRLDVFGGIIFDQKEVHIDENTLREIAQTTGGTYFRATSNDSLEKIYEEINSFEKSDVKSRTNYHYQEFFRIFLWIAFFTLLLDALFRWVIFKTIV